MKGERHLPASREQPSLVLLFSFQLQQVGVLTSFPNRGAFPAQNLPPKKHLVKKKKSQERGESGKTRKKSGSSLGSRLLPPWPGAACTSGWGARAGPSSPAAARTEGLPPAPSSWQNEGWPPNSEPVLTPKVRPYFCSTKVLGPPPPK